MKMLLALLSISICSLSFANSTQMLPKTHSSVTAVLHSAWEQAKSTHLSPNQHDLNMVYGGKDISLKPTTEQNSTAA